MKLRLCVWPQHGVTQGHLWVQGSSWKTVLHQPRQPHLAQANPFRLSLEPHLGFAEEEQVGSVWKRTQKQPLLQCGCSADQDRWWPGEVSYHRVQMCGVHGTALSCCRDHSGQRVAPAGAMERTHVPCSALSQAKWRCSTGSGPAVPAPGTSSSSFPLGE